MTTIDLNDLLARVCALDKEAMLTIGVTADAVPYFFHTQESFPYFTHRISDDTVDDDSQDFDRDTYNVVIRLVIGHATEAYVGEPESLLYDAIPVIKEYFNEREELQSAAFATAMRNLIEARVIGSSGFRVFQNAGISAQQVGTEFTLQCGFDETIDQAYT